MTIMDTTTDKSPIIGFKNCQVLRNHRIYSDDVWVREGVILDPQKCFFEEKRQPDIIINCKGKLLAPGYIETQINGAFGVDFSYHIENIEEGISKVGKGLLERGVTSYCPTLVTSPSHVYHKVIPRVQRYNGSSEGAGVLGLHLEGPFISREKKGAHPEKYLRHDLVQSDESRSDSISSNGGGDNLKALEEMYGAEFYNNTSIVTLAPELPGALNVIHQLTHKHNITASIGHSVGTIKDGEKAVRSGATFITHLFNAMLPFHHRDPGLVGLLTSWKLPSNTTLFYGMIADNIHTHPATMRIAHRTNPDGLVLVSDAVAAAGLEPGTYHVGQQIIDVKNGGAYVSGTETLAGSITLLDECVRTFYSGTECSKVEALEAATLHPAKLLGIETRKGTLDFGSDADIILLDDNLNVDSTYIAGECVYQRQTGGT